MGRDSLQNILSKSQGERALGRVAASYHRIPYVLFVEESELVTVQQTASGGTYRQVPEVNFRNDTDFVFEAQGVTFESTALDSSAVYTSWDKVEVRFIDVMRQQEWMPRASIPAVKANNSAGLTPVGALVDIVGKAEPVEGADILGFNALRWQFRYPTLIAPNGRITSQQYTYAGESTALTAAAAIYGALLVPSDSEPFRGAAARLASSYMNRFISPKEMEQLRQGGGYERQTDRLVPQNDVLGYERVPYVLHCGRNVAETTVEMSIPDHSNQTPYDFHIHEVGIVAANAINSDPNIAPRNIGVRVVDGLRNQEWNKELQGIAQLIPWSGSYMRIGQGTSMFGTKWGLGPGTILPPGGFLETSVQQLNNGIWDGSGESGQIWVAFIGSLLMPIIRGTLFADCYEKFLRAVPVRY